VRGTHWWGRGKGQEGRGRGGRGGVETREGRENPDNVGSDW